MTDRTHAGSRRGLLGLALIGLLPAGLCPVGQAATIRNYYSPWNRSRPNRAATEYIILHTTEGPKKGSLDKVHKNGETHYFVDAAGCSYRIIHRNRVALHAGRSMWNARTDIDNRSIGIEVEGYHDKHITEAQIVALRRLLGELQRVYAIPDERVLTHSMVAYGAPNRWHRKSHRGRKRCGMLFADPLLRTRLGLTKKPAGDPDVSAGRLVVGDPALHAILYGEARRRQAAATSAPATVEGDVIAAGRSAWDIARDMYKSSATVYVFPDGTKTRGDQIADWDKIPAGTRVVTDETAENAYEGVRWLGRDGKTPGDVAGDEYDKSTTIYFFPDGRVRRGDELKPSELNALPEETGMLVGYVYGGYVTAKRRAYDVCGPKWNFPSTLYRFPDGRFKTGDAVSEQSIPKGTLVFFQN